MFRNQPTYEPIHVCGSRKVMIETNNGRTALVLTDAGRVIERTERTPEAEADLIAKAEA